MLFKKFLNLFKKKQDLDKIVSEAKDQVLRRALRRGCFKFDYSINIQYHVQNEVWYRISKIKIPLNLQMEKEIFNESK